MVAADEDALICDFAETYHIYDVESLDCGYVATLAYGLRDNSRVRMAISGLKVNLESLLLAHIVDNTRYNVYMKTKNAQHHRNVPNSIVETLTKEKKKECQTFSSGDEFLKKWDELNNG